MSTQKLITLEENLHDSWVELRFDSCSEHNEDTPVLSDIIDLEKMLLEAQRESSSSSRTSSHCSSPRHAQTPPLISAAFFNTHIITQGEVVAESKQEAEAVARICDWSSRPENVPHTAFIIKRPKRNRMCNTFTSYKFNLLHKSLICIGRRLSTQCSVI
uniref:BCL2 interacting protein 4 n=1 Tax=Cyprinus carpio carpio TaxID=630221 RepID=A0A9J7XZB1_CYPCA